MKSSLISLLSAMFSVKFGRTKNLKKIINYVCVQCAKIAEVDDILTYSKLLINIAHEIAKVFVKNTDFLLEKLQNATN